jgi:inner membrane protein
VHPLQYILIGLALVIFYTLLLSISEFIHFDIAYLISAVAVITMITLYSKQLFNNVRSSLLTGGIITLQYAFIFVLIRLEDTALLVGSIGLFIVLGLVMYASRKIDWYGKNTQ